MAIRSRAAATIGVAIKVVALSVLLWNWGRSPPAPLPGPAGCTDSDYQTACDPSAEREWRAANSAQERDFYAGSQAIIAGVVPALLLGGVLLFYGVRPARPTR